MQDRELYTRGILLLLMVGLRGAVNRGECKGKG